MSKILRRVLKLTVTPAALLVSAKFISVFLIIAIYRLSFSIGSSANPLFSVQISLDDNKTALFINSYSNLITLLVISLPTLIMIVKKSVLQSAIENPRTVVKLTKLNILKWITNDKTAILQIALWVLFQWIISGIVIASTLSNGTYTWIAILAGTLAIVSTWGLVKTFENEIDKIYPTDNGNYL